MGKERGKNKPERHIISVIGLRFGFVNAFRYDNTCVHMESH